MPDPRDDEPLGEDLEVLCRALRPEAPSKAARGRLLAAVSSGPTRYAPFFSRMAALFDLEEDRVATVLEGVDDEAQWQPFPVDGVRTFPVSGGPAVAGMMTGLLWQEPGAVFPRHRHRGDERLLVLAGSLRDDGGRVYVTGDDYRLPAGTEHSVSVPSDDRCIAAIVLAGGLEFL